MAEIAPARRFWERGEGVISLHQVRLALRLAAKDPRVGGLVLSLKQAQLGPATAESLRRLLLEWRSAGKALVAYLPMGMDTRSLYLASAAERIFIGRETWVLPLGFSVESPYVRELLAKLGVEPDIFAKGKYKTAAEFLVSGAMSEAQREQLGALLDESWQRMMLALSEGRCVSSEQALAWMEGSPYDCEEAAQAGLVDGVLDEAELLSKLASLYAPEALEPLADAGTAEPARGEGLIGAAPTPDKKSIRKIPLIRLGSYARRRSLAFRPLWRRPFIAVVELSGAIVSKSPGPSRMGELAVDEEVQEALSRAKEDPRVKGVVLYVDSRGGSALASDRILRSVKELAEEKPVVACMGNVAASGGYMVSIGAHEIVANASTITGSIGVVAARMVVEQAAGRLGVQVERLKRGNRADMLSPMRHFTPDERARFQALLDAGYRRFIMSVAEARKRPYEEIEGLAQGRVWSGQAALERGLVDRIGGLEEAALVVRQMLGERGAKLSIISVRKSKMPSALALLSGASALGLALRYYQVWRYLREGAQLGGAGLAFGVGQVPGALSPLIQAAAGLGQEPNSPFGSQAASLAELGLPAALLGQDEPLFWCDTPRIEGL